MLGTVGGCKACVAWMQLCAACVRMCAFVRVLSSVYASYAHN